MEVEPTTYVYQSSQRVLCMVSKHVFELFPEVGYVVLNILSFVLIIMVSKHVSKLTVSHVVYCQLFVLYSVLWFQN